MQDTGNKHINLDSITALIVDDDKFSRTFIKTALYQAGIKNTKEASNAEEALELLENFKINLILLDQQLPSKTGLKFAEELKNHSNINYRDIPIIMITVDTLEKTVLDAKAIGICEYLVKPVSPLALKKRLNSALGIRNERL